MELESILSDLDVMDRGGAGTDSPSGETSGDVLDKAIQISGAPQAIVERFAGSSNQELSNNLAFMLSELADNPRPETVNLIYQLIEKIPNWDYGRTVNLMLLTVRTQTINDLAWDPPEPTPTVLGRFLSHCLGMESDGENDNADTALNILWVIHQWAESRGGLRSVFNAEERQAFRDKFDEAGLDPGPILEALGKD